MSEENNNENSLMNKANYRNSKKKRKQKASRNKNHRYEIN